MQINSLKKECSFRDSKVNRDLRQTFQQKKKKIFKFSAREKKNISIKFNANDKHTRDSRDKKKSWTTFAKIKIQDLTE